MGKVVAEDQKIEETRANRGAGTPADSDEFRIAVRCNVCRRWLTDPDSVVLGAGPTCRGDRD